LRLPAHRRDAPEEHVGLGRGRPLRGQLERAPRLALGGPELPRIGERLRERHAQLRALLVVGDREPEVLHRARRIACAQVAARLEVMRDGAGGREVLARAAPGFADRIGIDVAAGSGRAGLGRREGGQDGDRESEHRSSVRRAARRA
jgi:hypothetical protein